MSAHFIAIEFVLIDICELKKRSLTATNPILANQTNRTCFVETVKNDRHSDTMYSSQLVGCMPIVLQILAAYLKVYLSAVSLE